MKLATCVFLFLSLCGISIQAQDQKKVDSLLGVYHSRQADTTRLKALNKLFEEYRYTDDVRALEYVNLSILLAHASGNDKGQALTLYNKAVFESEHGNFDSSDHYIGRALKKYTALSDKPGAAKCRMAFGFNRYDRGDFPAALENFIAAAKEMEAVQNAKGMSSAYIWIGNVYNNGLSKPEAALVYYNKALGIQQQNNDGPNMAFTYNNIGNVYYYLKRYDSSLVYFKHSAELKEKMGNRKGLASTYNNLGNVYFDKEDYDNAFRYYKLSLDIRTEFGDKKGIVTSNINIGNIFIKRRQFAGAVQYHSRALEAAKEIGDKEGMKEAANSLAASYESLGDSKNALGYYKLSSRINDSLVNRDFNERIVEMQTKYETEKREAENKELRSLNTINTLEIERQKQANYIKNSVIVSVVILLFVLAGLAYFVVKKRRIQQEAELAAERNRQKELRIRSVIEAEEKERRRIAQDLHDGVGQILSAARLNLSSLETTSTMNKPSEKEALKNTLALIDDSVKEVRTVSHNMMPNTLIKLGLASAVREFITRIGNLPNLKIDLEIVGLDRRLDEGVETALYRAIQETVNNIIRHAAAGKVSIQLIRHETELSVVIEDNGKGFDVAGAKDAPGIGLKNIMSRIELIGGTVHFDSSPGRGTTVLMDIPLGRA